MRWSVQQGTSLEIKREGDEASGDLPIGNGLNAMTIQVPHQAVCIEQRTAHAKE
jgi:hypothetical protein